MRRSWDDEPSSSSPWSHYSRLGPTLAVGCELRLPSGRTTRAVVLSVYLPHDSGAFASSVLDPLLRPHGGQGSTGLVYCCGRLVPGARLGSQPAWVEQAIVTRMR